MTFYPSQYLISQRQFTHDPTTYPNPEKFDPERFLGSNPAPDTHNLTFGFGRRICPGKELADSSIFIAIAMSLASFNISKARDDSGKEIDPILEFTPGVIRSVPLILL